MPAPSERPRLHNSIDLAGGQDRLRDAVIYVADAYRAAVRFGQVKLNKTIWRADFRSFAERGTPVTGRRYQRLPQGPALVEWKPLEREMVARGLIEIQIEDLGSGYIEERIIPKVGYCSNYLSRLDLDFLDEAIQHYWDKTARESSDESHGVAWRTHKNRSPLPYELAILSDTRPRVEQMRRLAVLGQRRRWASS